jgi:Tfp pilus assembly protein PilN
VTVFSAITTYSLRTRERDLSAEATRLLADADRLRGETRAMTAQINPKELQAVSKAADEANAVIAQRTFSWVALLAELEATLPDDVRITAVQPHVEKGVTRIVLNIEAMSPEHLAAFMDALEKRGAFREVLPRDQTRGEDNILDAVVEAVYEPVTAKAVAPARSGQEEAAVNRSLIRRIAGEHRGLVITIAVLIVLNVILLAAFIMPLSRRVNTVTERTQQARNERAAAQFAHKRVSDALSGKSQASQELVRFYRDVLPANLVAARRLVYPRLEQMAEKSGLRATNATFEHVKERDHTLQELRIQMTLTGSYRGVREFIQHLQQSREFLVVERVMLKEGDLETAPLSLQLELSTYYKEQGQ